MQSKVKKDIHMKKTLLTVIAAAGLLMSCNGAQHSNEATPVAASDNGENAVIETIMSRRSVRDYLPQAVNRDTMNIIAKCGINAPNAMNAQSWEVRIVDNPEFIYGITQAFVKENPKAAADSKFMNMFRNAPTVAFIAASDGNYSLIDCGLLSENMILSAWSMGIGSCCLGGPVAFINSPAGKEYLDKLDFSEGHTLVLAIGFGYPAEKPEAKPRDESKVKFVD